MISLSGDLMAHGSNAAHTAAEGLVRAAPLSSQSLDISLGSEPMLPAIAAIFGLIGWKVGARRQAVVLLLSGLSGLLIPLLLPEVLGRFASESSAVDPLGEPVAFGGSVLLAYVVSRIARAPVEAGLAAVQSLAGLLDRIIGAAFGVATGYFAGSFVLPRMVTQMPKEPLVAQQTGAAGLDQSALVLWLVIVVTILFGVMSLESREPEAR